MRVKTTINLPDVLVQEAKRLAAKRGIPLREFFETALRKHLAAERQRPKPAPFRTHTFKGEGLQPGIKLGDWDQILDLCYGYDKYWPEKDGE